MKKAFKTIAAIGTAALAVVGGLYIFRKYFSNDEELEEVFDDEELFDDDILEDEIDAFDEESEIFDEEAPTEPNEETPITSE